MAAQTVDPSAEFEVFAAEQVKSGRFANAHEVLEATKSALLRQEIEENLDLEFLNRAIDEGDASGIYEGDAIADIREKYGLNANA